jgi:hypothetical protein
MHIWCCCCCNSTCFTRKLEKLLQKASSFEEKQNPLELSPKTISQSFYQTGILLLVFSLQRIVRTSSSSWWWL